MQVVTPGEQQFGGGGNPGKGVQGLRLDSGRFQITLINGKREERLFPAVSDPLKSWQDSNEPWVMTREQSTHAVVLPRKPHAGAHKGLANGEMMLSWQLKQREEKQSTSKDMRGRSEAKPEVMKTI